MRKEKHENEKKKGLKTDKNKKKRKETMEQN